MTTRRSIWALLAALPAVLLSWAPRARAQGAEAQTGRPGEMMLTIFLRHDETKTVDEINQHLKRTGWFRDFPPAGVSIVSWYVMMGIGQVVTVRFAAERLRDLNRLVEGEAWGGFRTEFYPTYDYRALYEQLREQMR
jgi:hypothetical protein